MSMFGEPLRLSSQGSSVTRGAANESAFLYAVNVNKTAASSSVNIYQGTSSGAGSVLFAVLDTSTTPRTQLFRVRSSSGFWANMQGGNADVTFVVL